MGSILDQEDPLEKGMATHSSSLAWRIPWTEEPGELQSIGSQRVRRPKQLSPETCRTLSVATQEARTENNIADTHLWIWSVPHLFSNNQICTPEKMFRWQCGGWILKVLVSNSSFCKEYFKFSTMSESGHFVKGGGDAYFLYQAKVLQAGVSGYH